MNIKCPYCQKVTTWEENPHRPFCSDRCKMIDLGMWASEEHRIKGESIDNQVQSEKENNNG